MRISPRRAEADFEGPFRTPEQLALAMPLIAMIGLMVVVSAVATGGSAVVVALVALGGFGLCALAPMALIDVYVTRPLRRALAQLRAARDGEAREGGLAPGVIGDLVHLARDIHAAQAGLGRYDATVEQCERMVAAGEEALRALRVQSASLAERAAPGDRRLEGSRAEIAELAEVVKGLRAAPAAGLDGAVERLESMLVYIAETLERIEARERPAESGLGPVEQGVADLARLVAREAENIQGALSSGGLTMRTDLAGVVVEEKIGRDRLLERLDALETNLSAKLGEAPSPDAREIAQAIHAEAEANRRALREDAASGRLEAVAADLSRAAAGIAQGLPPAPDSNAIAATLARLAEGMGPGPIVEALRGELNAAAPLSDELRAELAALTQAVARLVQEAAERAPVDPAPVVEALRAELSRVAEACARPDAGRARSAEPQGGDLASLHAGLDAVLESVTRLSQDRQAPAGAAGGADPLLAATSDFGEVVAERLRQHNETHARRLDEIEARVVDKILAVERDNDATTRTALLRATRQIGEAASRLDCAAAAPGDDAGARLEAEVQGVARAVEALSASALQRLDDVALSLAGASARAAREALDVEPLRQGLGEAEARLTSALAQVTAQVGERLGAFEAQALAPACGALVGATQEFRAGQARIEAAAAKVETGDPRLAEVADATADLRARLADLAAPSQTDALAPERAALALATQQFEAVGARLCDAAARIEAGDPRIAATVEALGTLSQTLAGLSAAAQSRSDDEGLKSLRDEVAAMQPRFERAFEDAVAGLPEVVGELNETQARWCALVESFQTDAQKLAALAEADGRGVDAVRADVSALAGRVEAGAEAQAARLSQDVETRTREAVAAPLADLTLAMRGLADAQSRLEAAFAERASTASTPPPLDGLRADFAAAADAAAARFDASAQALTRSVEDRIETLRRGELSPAIAAAQATAQDLNTAHASLFTHIEALKAALVTDRSAFASLRLDVAGAFAKVSAIGERADASIREAGARAAALASSLTHHGAVERAELGAVSRTLSETGARLELAARAFEDRRGDVDLPLLAADLTREIDALARATAERVLALESGVAALAGEAGAALGAIGATAQALDPAGIARQLDGFAQKQDAALRALENRLADPAASTLSQAHDLAQSLQEAMAQRGAALVEAVAENSARLDALARLHDERLDALETLLSAQPRDSRATPPAEDSKPSGAVAKLVVSMADALDLRFSHIETALADVAQRLQEPQVRRDDDALDAGVASLALQLQSASDTLKSGLSDFVGVSAALAEEVARSSAAAPSPKANANGYRH
jgi:hypothetical protein